MTYEEVSQLAEKLGYRDKFRLAQLLIQLARKEEEGQHPAKREADGAASVFDEADGLHLGAALEVAPFSQGWSG